MSQDMQALGVAQATPIAESLSTKSLAGLPTQFGTTKHPKVAALPTGLWLVRSRGPTATRVLQVRPAFAHGLRPAPPGRWEDTGVILNATSYQLVGVEGLINTGPLQSV